MNKDLLCKLVNKAGEMALANRWGDKALKINMLILEMDSSNSAACTRLAKYYKLHDNLEEAKKMYSRVLEINPDHQGARNNLIEIEKNESQKDLVNNFVTGKDAYNTARLYSQQGRYELSIKCLQKAYSIDPLLKYAVTLAKIYSRTGKTDEVKKLYQLLLNTNDSPQSLETINAAFKAIL
ncbi:MAG: hypothetical protein Q8920_06965 [Bacillota bacterium]|nr:hypothetical protein [Bacillota bacterium]